MALIAPTDPSSYPEKAATADKSPAASLADLTVVWDEREGQVITVRDDARLRDAAQRWADWDSLWDEESFAPEPLRHSAAA